jgi:hypothetical protein
MQQDNHKIFKTSDFSVTASVLRFLIPLILKVPSFAFYTVMTIGSVEIIKIRVKTGKKTEAPLVTATADSRWRSHTTMTT